MQRLHASLASHGGRDHQLSDLQAQLCALLQVLIKRLDPADVAKCADNVMTIFLAVFHSSASAQLRAVQGDALMAISALIDGVLLLLLPLL